MAVMETPVPTLVAVYYASGGTRPDPFSPDPSKGETWGQTIETQDDFALMMAEARARHRAGREG